MRLTDKRLAGPLPTLIARDVRPPRLFRHSHGVWVPWNPPGAWTEHPSVLFVDDLYNLFNLANRTPQM